MISVDNEEIPIGLMNHISRNVELKVIKDVLNVNYGKLQQSKTALREEYKKLDNVNYNVWAIEDSFCNEIWNFSFEHNFNALFGRYPNVPEVIRSHECKLCDLVTDYDEGIDIGKKSTLIELEKEIDGINNEIALIRNESIEQEIKNATSTLDSLKSFSEEILDLIRLITDSQNTQNIRNIPTNQQLTNKGFENARNLFKKSDFSSRVTTEKKVTTKMRIIEKPKHGYNKGYSVIKDNAKFGKFVMKKRSLISLRFERQSKISK